MSASFRVAIVGAGASGTLVAAQFNRLAPHERIAIIGNATRPARGVAYETPYRANLLNVPAGNMSAFPNDMNHFAHWLKLRQPKADANTFATRRVYGDYLAEIFHQTISDMKHVEYIVGTANCISRKNNLWTIHLEDGSSLEAHNVVLAFGNLLIPSDPIDFNAVTKSYWKNPWSSDVAQELEKDAPVLLVGTGLTMVDVALSLREVGHRGPMHTLSRHGRLYKAHEPYQARQLKNVPEDFKSPLGALRWIRREINIAEKSGSNWRAVIDSLRPHTASIWQSWNQTQRESFLRHARNLWDIHRHRMSPEIATQLNALMENGTLIIHRGKLVSAAAEGQNAKVTWKDTDTAELKTLTVARIVNCTGPTRDYSQIQSPLIADLISTGLLVPDALKLGFETDSDGRFIDRHGEPVQGLFTLGPVRIPALWESIAIPEIRNQALALAKSLISENIETNIPA